MSNLKNDISTEAYVPVKRLRAVTTANGIDYQEVKHSKPFLKGPIPLDWLNNAGKLPGKSLHLALVIRWLVDMNGGKPTKITAKALERFGISPDACSDGLKRLETANLITVKRLPGQRPTVAYRDSCQQPQSSVAPHPTFAQTAAFLAFDPA